MPKLSGHATIRYGVPPDACDCHMHVFGAVGRYPIPRLRNYTPREASLTRWRLVAKELGLQRVVVVQPSVYGADNSCVVDALGELGSVGRGIAQIDASTTDTMLRALHAAGIRGVRLNPKSVESRNAEALRALITEAACRIAPFCWHIEIYAELAIVAEIALTIREVPVPVVLDHMGGATAGDDHTALRPLLDLLTRGQCWVKLSGAYRASREESGFADSIAIAKALVNANAERVVWGTDWPHTARHGGTSRPDAPPIEFRTLDEAALLDGLAEAAGDEATFSRILVANPAQLYGFGS